ncbi:O-methylsterigmatocystin oxidoreductase [Ganoderma leucocontextum]|nr:O-methylsterigmatocystin oxidoreductase [Ganoderma leucocontextum]
MPVASAFPPGFAVVSAIILLSLTCYLRSVILWRRRTRGRPLPPGPRRLPIIGSFLDMPTVRPWGGLRDLCNEYGSDIIYLRTPGQDNIILGSAAAVSEVMEQRTANSSDRLVGPMVRLSGNEWTLGLIPYGQTWRDYRRALWQHFHPGAIVKYRPAQQAIVPLFLKKLLDEPEGFKQHIQFVFSATLLKVVYGIDIDDGDHEIVHDIRDAVEGISEAFVPGRFLVDYIPWLEYVPAWFPGAGFQKKFATWRAKQVVLTNAPFQQRNTSLCKGDYVMPSCVTVINQLLSGTTKRDNVDAAYWDNLIKSVAAVVYEAGADTSVATMQSAFLAMSLYPEVQRKAQAELDRVVGCDRLPDFDDLDSLVYIHAIVKESLRWHTVTPLGIPHRTMKDDIFRGYFFPAGSVLIANVWACMHDADVYQDPDEFRPDRFIRGGRIDPGVLDPSTIVFGAGRRICPGRYFAESMLLLNMASALHVFEISAPVDDDGNPIRIHPSMTDGELSYLEDCRCTVKPRFPEAAALIDRELAGIR